MSDLGSRARKILYAAITEYIATGEPVGSRTLERRYGLHLSAASIRNVLADLEEGGFLAQPHTSAGRVPTDAGFRVFVDALVQVREVTPGDRSRIETRMRALEPGADVMREAGKLLSSLTGAAAVLTPPRPEEERLAQLRFMPLAPGELLAVLITRSGAVQNRVVHVQRELDPGELERVHRYLEDVLARGTTLAEARQAVADAMASEGAYADLRSAKTLLDAAVSAGGPRDNVVIEGQGLLLERPEFADVEKLRSLVRAFEDRERLLDLLDRTLTAGGVQVLIGKETNLGDVEDLTMISASYRHGGSLGVIGPTRMDYGKVVPLVGYTASVVADLLDGNDDSGARDE